MNEDKHAELKKTQKACDQCRARKVKCDGLSVCSRCKNKGVSCTYEYVFKQRSRKIIEPEFKPERKRGRPKKSTVETLIINNSLDVNNRNDHNDNNKNEYNNMIAGTNYHASIKQFTDPNENILNGSDIGNGFRGVRPIVTTHKSTSIDTDGYISKNNTLNIPVNTEYASDVNNENHQTDFPYNSNTIRGTSHDLYNTSVLSYGSVTTPNGPVTNIQDIITLNRGAESGDLEKRLRNMESLVSLLLDKVSNSSNTDGRILQSPSNSSTKISSLSGQNISPDYTNFAKSTDIEESKLSLHVEEAGNIQKLIGLFMHTSVFFLSSSGIKLLESKMEKPEAIRPLKKVIEVSTPIEKKILSIWKNPIDASQLSPLPSRYNINCLLNIFFSTLSVSNIVDEKYLKYLCSLYCDYRDGLISEPQFTYSDYFLVNTSLLIAIVVAQDITANSVENVLQFPDFESFQDVEYSLLDNSIFYYHRVSLISSGLSTVSAALLLGFYADNISLSRASYLILSNAIRQAQELGLHLDESYRGLIQEERTLRLNVWWICYYCDKEMCSRWGQSPVINDDDVSTAPLPGFEAYWSLNSSSAKSGIKSKRSVMTCEIQASLDAMLTNHSSTKLLEQYILLDYAFLASNVYTNFLSVNAFNEKTKAEGQEMLNEFLFQLECWKKNIPESLRPKNHYDKSYYEDIEVLKKENTKFSLYKMVLATGFHVRYHHMKLMVYRAFAKFCFLEFSSPIKKELMIESTISARCVLRMSCIIDNRFRSYINYIIFYPFNAFLAICGLYINVEEKLLNMELDFQLLIDSLRLHFGPFSLGNAKGRILELILKSMLYATYNTCVSRFGEMNLVNLEVLDEIRDLVNEKVSAEELIHSKPIQKLGTVERKFCKLPIFPPQNSKSCLSSNIPNLAPSEIPNLRSTSNPPNELISDPTQVSHIPQMNGYVDRTPNVSFLLSPSHFSGGDNNISTPSDSRNTNAKTINEKNPFVDNAITHITSPTNVSSEADSTSNPKTTDKAGEKERLLHSILSIPNYYLDFNFDDGRYLPPDLLP